MTRTHCTGLLGIILASFVILTAQEDPARKGRKIGSPALIERFILNIPPLLCGVDEIRINLVDGGQTNRAKPPLPFALISPVSLTKRKRQTKLMFGCGCG